MNYLDQLNERQREAVVSVDGPLLVVAGAGSGKTRVITYKIAYLIDQMEIEPWHILAVTFTNKAADEMRQRVERILAGRALVNQPQISTFHSFCLRVLRRHIELLEAGYTQNFSIYDDDDSQRVIKAALKQLHLDDKVVAPRTIQAAISQAKSRGLSAAGYMEQVKYAGEAKKDDIARVFQLYEQRLRAANALDFDDLLLKAVELLRRDPAVRQHYNQWFHHILIDEYQDTNRPQFDLVRLLTEKRQNLCVVGDPDQSIYRFRGADIQNIIEFETHYPNAQVITLDQNYRSTQRILMAANDVIHHNTQRPEKSLRTDNDLGERVAYYHAFNGDDEARFVIHKFKELSAAGRDAGHQKIRAAVLYRTNAQSRLFEDACRREGIGFNIVGGFSFYKRAEIRDIIAYLKLALNPWDDESLLRIINSPTRGLGQKTIEAVQSVARQRTISLWESLALVSAEHMLPPRSLQPLQSFKSIIERLESRARTDRLSDVVRAAMRETGYVQALEEKSLAGADPVEAENRLMNLEELLSAAVEAEERGESLRQFVDHAALVSDADEYDPDAPATLMTMHSAKGLEFPVVFMVGLEEGLFPHARSSNDVAELEEERRLCYVAITRAQRRLYLTHARSRRLHGEETLAKPSQFLSEMPLDQLEDLSFGQSWLRSQVAPVRSSETTPPKPARAFDGKTYNSVESLQEYFKQKGLAVDLKKSHSEKKPPGPRKGFSPGTRVHHPKYGVGQVLKREGAGEDVKLTIRFPGFGDRKLMERVAELEEL
jgi:DNA helicase-2/ATP-dependent DNA helicase PcrA